MAIDAAPLGELSMKLIDRMQERYGPEATLVRALVVVEVDHSDPEDIESVNTTVHWDSTAASRIEEAGLATVLLWGMEPS